MIKLGFKLFGCCTVFLFFALAGILMAVNTVPPAYSVRKEIRDFVYPPAREHLVDKFRYYMGQTIEGVDMGEFKISEIEANAYLYWWAQQFVPNGIEIIEDPYLFIDKERLVLRFDIPVRSFFDLASAAASGRSIEDGLKTVSKSDKKMGNLALTFIFRAWWVEKEEKPYFYFEKFYVGVLPVPIPFTLADYQDQFNMMVEDGYYKSFKSSPVYIRKLLVEDKGITLKTELKVTDAVAMRRKAVEFEKENPWYISVKEKRNCLYGCTDDERQKLKEWMGKINNRSANDVTSREAMVFSSMKNTMNERKMQNIKGLHQRVPDVNDWRYIMEQDPDRDWGVKNWPYPDIPGKQGQQQ